MSKRSVVLFAAAVVAAASVLAPRPALGAAAAATDDVVEALPGPAVLAKINQSHTVLHGGYA